jgi:hypothetical protein
MLRGGGGAWWARFGIAALAAAAILLAATAVAAPQSSPPTSAQGPDLAGPQSRTQLERADLDRRAAKAQRETPEAVSERERSKTAFAGASDAQALDIAERKFPDTLTSPPFTGPRLGPGERIARVLDDRSALIDLPDGTRAILQSSLPLEGQEPSGASSMLDMTLDDQGSTVAPHSTLAPLRIAKRLGDGIGLGPDGLALRPDAIEDPNAELQLVQGKAFWSNVQPDTDFMAQPLPTGVETFWQLRSPKSPESLTLRLDLPPGERLAMVQPSPRPAWAAPAVIGVMRGNDRIATILPPGATDAQQAGVPTSYEIEGSDKLVVRVGHRAADVAYPILVDPVFEYYSGTNFPNWYFTSNEPAGWFFTGTGNDGAGLYVGAYRGGCCYDPGAYGEWVHQSRPGSYDAAHGQYTGTYVYRLDLAFVKHVADATTYVSGIYSPMRNGWEPGAWTDTSVSPNEQTWSGASFYDTRALTGNYKTFCARPVCPWQPPGDDIQPGNEAIFGLQVDDPDRTNRIPAYVYLPSAYTFSYDHNAPYFTRPADGIPTTGWTENYSAHVVLHAQDDGYGMSSVSLGTPGSFQTVPPRECLPGHPVPRDHGRRLRLQHLFGPRGHQLVEHLRPRRPRQRAPPRPVQQMADQDRPQPTGAEPLRSTGGGVQPRLRLQRRGAPYRCGRWPRQLGRSGPALGRQLDRHLRGWPAPRQLAGPDVHGR